MPAPPGEFDRPIEAEALNLKTTGDHPMRKANCCDTSGHWFIMFKCRGEHKTLSKRETSHMISLFLQILLI
jgi:hypothetical protein